MSDARETLRKKALGLALGNMEQQELAAAIREVLDEADSYMRATDNLAHKLSAAEAENERLRAEVEEQDGDTAADRARKYAARIDAALALHTSGLGGCQECSGGGESVAWPCPTVKALKGGE